MGLNEPLILPCLVTALTDLSSSSFRQEVFANLLDKEGLVKMVTEFNRMKSNKETQEDLNDN